LYPYNPGHLMVVPYRHVADYPDLTTHETTELATFTQRAMLACRRAAAPHGFNIGINQGSVGGAGIAAHLHQHVVPRWGGDTNFMPVVAGTKVLPQLLSETRQMIAAAWPAAQDPPAVCPWAAGGVTCGRGPRPGPGSFLGRAHDLVGQVRRQRLVAQVGPAE